MDGEGRTAYLVMELVNGEPLNSVLKRTGRLSLRHALDMLEQTGRALQVAHTAGLVHRDVKPGNILITPTGPGEAHRLRHRQGRRRRPGHPDRHGDGHRPVHRARAGARPRRHRGQRRLLAGSRWLRVGFGQAPVHRRRRADRGDEAHQGDAAAAARRPAAQRSRADRDHAGEEPGHAVPLRRAVRRRGGRGAVGHGARRGRTRRRPSAGRHLRPCPSAAQARAAADVTGRAPHDRGAGRDRPPAATARQYRRGGRSPRASARCCGRPGCSARWRSSSPSSSC